MATSSRTHCPNCGATRVRRRLRVTLPIVLALYAVTFAVCWVVGGAFLHDLVEGMRRDALPWWRIGVCLAVAGVTASAAIYRTRRPVCGTCGADVPSGMTIASGETAGTRRALLRAGGAVAVASVGGVAAAVGRNAGWVPVFNDFFVAEVETTARTPDPAWSDAHVKTERRLGRTNVMVSDISVGCGQIKDVAVPRLALERGVTYFDTSPDYSGSQSEKFLGEAIKGQRDKVFLATKFCRPEGHLPNDTPVPEIIASVEESLQRLQTDHVDLIHVHSCDRVDRLMAPNIHEAFDRLKEQGKVRFLGVSTHTPNLEEVANAAIDSGRFDVMMLAYHFGMWPQFNHILEKAKQHDVGVVAMKTLKGAKHTDLAPFRDDASSYAQSAFRWVLSNPNVSCLVVSFSQLPQVDEYLAASGTALQPSDVARLERYDTLVAGDYCQPHCGACLDSCPDGLPINDVLRYRMYARDYHWEREGMERYAMLARDASVCAGCPAPCAGTCPQDIPIRHAMLDAHHRLRLPTKLVSA